MKKLLLGALIVLAAGSCSKPLSPEFKELKNISLRKLPTGLDLMELSAELVLFNPNSFSVELQESNLDLFVGDQFLGKARQTQKIRVPAKQNFSLPVSLKVPTHTLLKSSLNLLSNQPVKVGAKGSVNVGKAGIFKKIDIDYKGLHTMPKLSLF
jgi:LEA14-like dessication related protein